MPKAPSSAQTLEAPSRPSARRSVWGCLTCRRRKVKCHSRETPCESCSRLHLTCVPSFSLNFKQWKGQHLDRLTSVSESGPTIVDEGQPTMRSPSTRVDQTIPRHDSLTALDLSPDSLDSLVAPDGNGAEAACHEDVQVLDDWGATGRQQTWDMGVAFLSTGHASYTSPDFYPALSVFADDADGLQADGSSIAVLQETSGSQVGPFLDEDRPRARTKGSIPSTLNEFTQTPAHFMLLSDRGNHMHDGEGSVQDVSCSWNSIQPLSSRLDDDYALVEYYKQNLSSFFSVKSSHSATWNFYSFAIRSSESQPDSPLRHSILAWTAAHLILRNECPSGHTQFRHYSRARAAVDDLRLDLAGNHDSSTASRYTSSMSSVSSVIPSTSQKLRMLLSTSLFLGYCDILSGDSAALVDELASIKQLLESDWPRFREALGPLEARILVWLAYLDLRSSLWKSRPSLPSATAAAETNKQQKQHSSRLGLQKRKDSSLFHFLNNNAGFLALRSLRSDRYYLTECFGSSLPQQELKEDLLQEPAKMLSDEIMSIYATISDFEDWMDGVDAQQGLVDDSSLIEELRQAKIQAIRANIARIRAECKVIHAELLRASSGPEHVVRTEFHRLVTTAMCLSATIMLNRIEAPKRRTDDEAQAAAQEIIRIARTLRETGYVCSPRSLVWPMPVFVAGIEVTDPIYQDWVLNYMSEVSNWGTSTKKARELLRRVIERQETQSRRVKVRELIGEFGEAIMI